MSPAVERSAIHELANEHGVLVRQLAGLQQRMSDLAREHARCIAELKAAQMRLHVERVLLHTCVLWGLGVLARPRPVARAPVAPDLPAAHAVICQTGCVGHAHHWLDGDGQCRRTGQVCDRVTEDHGTRER